MRMISVLALLTVACLATDGRELAFAPEQGRRFEKSFESSLDLTLEALTIQRTEMPEPLSHLWMDVTLAEKRRSVVVDEYVTPPVDRPRSLLRTFESLSLEQWFDFDNRTNDEDFHAAYEGHSRLEGARVRFSPDVREGGSSATFDVGGDRDVELLQALEEDMDLRAFLPSGGVETGSAWKVDAAALRSFFEPVGRIRFMDAEAKCVESFDPGFVDRLQGVVEVVFVDRRDVVGTSVARLRIHGLPTARLEPSESAGEVQLGLGYTTPGINFVSASLELDVSGEILWDLEERHLRSAWLAADVVMKRETRGQPTESLSETWVRETWRGCACAGVRVTRK